VSSAKRPRILTFADYYLPGYKAGGSIRTLANMVERLSGELEFRLVTRDRDFGEPRPYAVQTGDWVVMGDARVRYLPPEAGPRAVRAIVKEESPDLIYLNSFFSYRFTLAPLLAAMVPRTGIPVVVAPRGELSPGAISLKRWKKLPYVRAMRMAGFFDRVTWQASSPHEEEDVRRWFGPRARVRVAPDLCGALPPARCPTPEKRRGELRVVFMSRIARKKNLDWALRGLGGVAGRVHLTIYGPVQEELYWSECQALIGRLPENVRVTYSGPVAHEEINQALRQHHLFLLPTRSENFGHAILEGLLAGLPVIVSDQTPWTGLEALGVGADLPLSRPEEFVRVVQRYVDLDSAGYEAASARARAYGEERSLDPDIARRNLELFSEALRS